MAKRFRNEWQPGDPTDIDGTDPKRPGAPVTDEHRQLVMLIEDIHAHEVLWQGFDLAFRHLIQEKAQIIAAHDAQVEARARLAEAEYIRDEQLDAHGWELVDKDAFEIHIKQLERSAEAAARPSSGGKQ